MSKVPSDLENCRIYVLFNQERGLMGWRKDNPYAISPREFMERYFYVKSKGGQVVPFRLNRVQRILEARVARAERSGKPVRIVILKGRQFGCSTWAILRYAYCMLTRPRFKTKLVADVNEKATELMQKVALVFDEMHKENGDPWRITLEADTVKQIKLGWPLSSAFQVTSAEAKNPGHSETVEALHMTETSRWKDAQEQAYGLEITLPELPGTFGIDETTAHGDQGYFRDKFMRAWNRERGITEEMAASATVLGGAGWGAVFFPWFLHHEDRWSHVNKVPLPKNIADEITDSLTDDEVLLLKQTYIERGKGLVSVDLDQLAWRRYYISEKCAGSLDTFHEQFPAFPEEAFLASGRPVFDQAALRKVSQTMVCEPEWKGDIEDVDGDPLMSNPLMRSEVFS